jgi:hypothetical protein
VSLNQWQSFHWGKQYRIKKEWLDHCWAAQNSQGKLPRDCVWLYCDAQLVFPSHAHRDLTNYTAVLWKIVPDALQRLEIIRDDTEEVFIHGEVEIRVGPKAETRLALIVPA